MPVTDWYTSVDAAGKTWLNVHLMQVKICVDDPDAGMFIAIAAPIGGVAAWPALLKGDPGPFPTFTTPVMHPMESDDITPDSVTFTQVSPGTATTGPVYRADFWLHKGVKGDPGDTNITPTDFGTPVYKRIIQVNSALTGFEYVAQKVGGAYWPTAVTEAPSGTSTSADLCPVVVPAQPFPWIPEVGGVTVISPSLLASVKVDFVARLGGSGGPVVGRCPGLADYPDRLVLPPGPPTNAAASSITVAAGTAATILFRTEKQGGLGTWETGSVAPTTAWVKVVPLP